MKIITILFLLFSGLVCSQKLHYSTFQNWEKNSQSQFLIIHIYTDWCTVCAVENFKINKNKTLLNLLNTHFSLIKMEAEKTKEDIIFLGKKYSFVPNGNSGLHEFVSAFSKNKSQPVYPLWMVMDKEGQLLYYQEGSFKKGEMESVLKNIIQHKK